MVRNTRLDVQQNPGKQQSYQGISAETVGVGANNQVKKNGKPVNCDGAAGNVDSRQEHSR
ncbi:MAG: hypothetical protein G8D91_19205 [gamma proteobacterium symbiont of Clathrolucina costata]